MPDVLNVGRRIVGVEWKMEKGGVIWGALCFKVGGEFVGLFVGGGKWIDV